MQSRCLALSFLVLTGCFFHPSIDAPVALAPGKQKQKVALLQKKLIAAEKAREKAASEVETLQDLVNAAELALILSQIATYEQQLTKHSVHPQLEASTLFLKEREALHQMIQSGPSPAAFEAQVVLDRILRMITALSDHNTKDY